VIAASPSCFIVRRRQHSNRRKTARVVGRAIACTPPGAAPLPRSSASPFESKRTYLEGLRKFDPEFSLVLFEDFLYTLFAKIHEARGKKQLDLSSPDTSPLRSRKACCGRAGLLREIKAIVVASFEITGVVGLKKLDSPNVRVALAFTANYTEVYDDGTEQSFWVAEAWEVSRKRDDALEGARRRCAPSAVRAAAPRSRRSRATRCHYCKEPVDRGRGRLGRHQARGDGARGARAAAHRHTEEEGSDLPTVIDPDAKARLGALSERDPSVLLD
jgi:hypothetical protein